MKNVERVCISVNSACNFACRYCYFHNPQKPLPDKDPLNQQEILTILRRIDDYSREISLEKPIKVNFVGSGEPLLAWSQIRDSLQKFLLENRANPIKFYMVSNGTLLTRKILQEMREVKIIPSISLDGPPSIHDANRVDMGGKGTFERVMSALELLRKEGFDIVINTTITQNLIQNLQDYFVFLQEAEISKVIFDRLVDVPPDFPPVSYSEFYAFLMNAYRIRNELGLEGLEIGNLESYRRAISQKADVVCTMFGSCCGAGLSHIIYLQREVFPCGRMFTEKRWKLGNYQSPLSDFREKMADILRKRDKGNSRKNKSCESCEVNTICIQDCLLEQDQDDYDCRPRKDLLKFLQEEYNTGRLNQ